MPLDLITDPFILEFLHDKNNKDLKKPCVIFYVSSRKHSMPSTIYSYRDTCENYWTMVQYLKRKIQMV